MEERSEAEARELEEEAEVRFRALRFSQAFEESGRMSYLDVVVLKGATIVIEARRVEREKG